MPFNIGDCFTNIKTESLGSHLHIVISLPFDNPEKIVIVNITSWRDNAIELNDPACVLNVGDHRFLKEKSYIYYRKARCPKTMDLQEALVKGLIILDEPCSHAVLVKILDGAATSKFILNGIRRILVEQELV